MTNNLPDFMKRVKLDDDALLFLKSLLVTNIGLIIFIILTGYIFDDFMNSFDGILLQHQSYLFLS